MVRVHGLIFIACTPLQCLTAYVLCSNFKPTFLNIYIGFLLALCIVQKYLVALLKLPT